MKSVSKWKIFGSSVAAVLLVQLSLGLLALTRVEHQKRGSYRLRPRYVSEVDVRGRTYHLHPGATIDLKHRRVYEERRKLNEALKPHLVARRDILGKVKNFTGNEEFTDVNGDDTPFNINCFGSCAIVGMAGTLLGSKQGKEIDASSCIFRPGLSPTSGFEEHVGKRTTARIVDAKTMTNLLKKHTKITSGHLSIDTWIYYNLHDSPNVPWMLFRLREIKRKFPRMSFLRFNKRGEHLALSSLQDSGAKLGYSVIGVKPSLLWHTVRVAVNANCSSTKVFGIPNPKYCKRNLDSSIQSRYWDKFSPAMCENGNDPGAGKPDTPNTSVLSVTDRRGLKGWSLANNVTFYYPSWS